MASSQTRDPKQTAKLALGAVLLVLLTLFIVGNTESTTISFLVGEVDLPLILVLLVTAVLGAVVYELFRFRRNRS